MSRCAIAATTGRVSISASTRATAGATTTALTFVGSWRHRAGGISPEGWFGGGQVGYNAQFNALVLGLEADLQGADISDTTGLAGGAVFTQATTDIEWFSTVRGRVGYAAGPALLYVTGGWAFADVNSSVTSSGGFGTVSMSSDDIKIRLHARRRYRVGVRTELVAEVGVPLRRSR